MAITQNTAKFLLWARNLGVSFNRTLTLGHLNFHCEPEQLRRAARDFNFPATEEQIQRCCGTEPDKLVFVDDFLRLLGASEVVAADQSNYEGANLIHDLNQPFPEHFRGTFDVVLDGGTLEHVFDFPSALRNCLQLVSLGGHFLTIGAPANQSMGHGFYQFSPELFFRIFNADNGFQLRKIILYRPDETDAPFYLVRDPASLGRRVEVYSSRTVCIALMAQRTSNVPILARPPQQSDYVSAWNSNDQQIKPTQTDKLRASLNPYWPIWLRLWKRRLASRIAIGPRSLENQHFFQRLSHREVARERGTKAIDRP